MKKAFTFFELLVVVSLLAITYGIFVVKFDFSLDNKKPFLFKNLKSFLIQNYEFENNLKVVCLEFEKECFVLLDDDITQNNKLEPLFEEVPQVYSYEKDYKKIDFSDIEFEDFQSYKVAFEFKINRDNKSDEMIVAYKNKVYIFTSLNQKAMVIDNLSDINDLFEEKISEVKNAF